jgi:hypothetical protein
MKQYAQTVALSSSKAMRNICFVHAIASQERTAAIARMNGTTKQTLNGLHS